MTGLATPAHSHVPSLKIPNRWLIAAAAFCMQLALGSVYGWSVFLNPLHDLYGATKSAVGLTFTITLVAVGITAGFGGHLQGRFGPRAVATAAGVLYGSGVFLSSLAPNVYVLYVTYGVLGGIGLGLGYIVPLGTLIRWFPDRRGFITGLAVTGFGLGAFVTSPIVSEAIKARGVQETLGILGATYLIMVVAAAQFMRAAPEDYVPHGWIADKRQTSVGAERNYTLREALRSPKWYLLWSILALNVTAGAALISVAAAMAQDFARVDTITAALLVSMISLFNGIGRLFWGSLSDSIGRPLTFLVIFGVQVFAFVYLSTVSDFWSFLIPAVIIALCFGGGFGTMPAFVADTFGPKNSGTIYGAMLTAWSAGAIAGPVLISNVPYRPALLIIAGTVFVATALPLIARASARRSAPASLTGPSRT